MRVSVGALRVQSLEAALRVAGLEGGEATA